MNKEINMHNLQLNGHGNENTLGKTGIPLNKYFHNIKLSIKLAGVKIAAPIIKEMNLCAKLKKLYNASEDNNDNMITIKED